jgi:leucyl/phenylalanyl-tRNA--protein transferase
MFSRATSASKVALAWLVALLRHGGYQLLDCQFMTEHLATLGAVMLSREAYMDRLGEALPGLPAAPLPEAYASLLTGSSGVAAGWGLADGVGASSRALSDGAGPSSPGKLIAQSLTHTS